MPKDSMELATMLWDPEQDGFGAIRLIESQMKMTQRPKLSDIASRASDTEEELRNKLDDATSLESRANTAKAEKELVMVTHVDQEFI